MVPNFNVGCSEDVLGTALVPARAGQEVSDLREELMPGRPVTTLRVIGPKEASIRLPKYRADKWNKILRRRTMVPDAGREEVLDKITVKFGDGREADFKLCNGRPPFLDPVLFEDGRQIDLLDVAGKVQGVYAFSTGHVVTIQVF